MADYWSEVLFEASWGGVPLQVVDVKGPAGRAVMEHKGPNRDGAEVEDLGRDSRPATFTIQFVGEKEHDDYTRFMTLVALGRPQTLWHPLRGQYEAWVGAADVSASADQRDTLVMTVTFYEDRRSPAVVEVGMGSPSESAIDSVDAAAAELEGAATNAGLTTTLPDDARELVALWNEAERTTDEVANEIDALAADVDAFAEDAELAYDTETYPVLVAASNLLDAVKSAGEAILTTSTQMMEITTKAEGPLLSILTGIYGAADALTHEAEVLEANEIANPLCVEAGRTLRVPNPATGSTR